MTEPADPDRRPDVDPFRGLDVGTMLRHWADTRRGREAIAGDLGGSRRSWTYDELHTEVTALARHLRTDLGVRRRDRVAVATGNSPEFLLGMFAVQALGAVAVALHGSSTPTEIGELMASTRCVGVIVGSEMRAQVADVVRRDATSSAPRWALAYGTTWGDEPRSPHWRLDRFEPPTGDTGAGEALDVEIDRFDPALVLFTSGSTGRPKAVVWTQSNVLWAARTGADHAGLRADDRFLVHLPLAHVVALSYSALATLWAGGTVLIEPRFSVSRFWPTALAERATWTHAIAFVVKALRDTPVPQGHHFRRWIYGRANSEWDELYGIEMMGVWGMTEMVSQPIYSDGVTPTAFDSLGRAASEYAIRIVGTDGVDVSDGTPGQLQVRGVRGVSVAAGYDDPEHAASGWRNDGWFETGDIVVRNPDGSISYVSRGKDVVTVGGETVYCREIEVVAESVAGVGEAIVVGVPDEIRDERPVVFVVPASADVGESLEERVAAVCEERLSAYKRPARVVIVEGDVPRLASGKPDKAALRRRAAALGARPEADARR